MELLRTTAPLLYRRNLFPRQIEARWCALQSANRLSCSTAPTTTTSRSFLLTTATLVFSLDLILGWVAVWVWVHWEGGVLLERAAANYTISSLRLTRELLGWVMGAPAGLKLNTPLSLFLGSRCLYLLRLWEGFYHQFLSLYLPLLLKVVPTLTACVGLSTIAALLHDFFKFLNLCHICFFVFSSRLLSLQLSALISLSRLFRGKKWNVLRQRVDSCDYNTNQLLLGTIVFTVLLFLLPTTTVFAALFFSLRVLQWSVQFLFRIVVVGINWSTSSLFHIVEGLLREESLLRVRVGRCEVVWRGRRWEIGDLREEVTRRGVEGVLSDLLGENTNETKLHPLATVSGLWTKL